MSLSTPHSRKILMMVGSRLVVKVGFEDMEVVKGRVEVDEKDEGGSGGRYSRASSCMFGSERGMSRCRWGWRDISDSGTPPDYPDETRMI